MRRKGSESQLYYDSASVVPAPEIEGNPHFLHGQSAISLTPPRHQIHLSRLEYQEGVIASVYGRPAVVLREAEVKIAETPPELCLYRACFSCSQALSTAYPQKLKSLPLHSDLVHALRSCETAVAATALLVSLILHC